jgi:Fe2+ or Zn2+ uptake regulation protein
MLRNTIQRARILAHLESVKNHPTAEELYDEIKKEMPAISIATVYRNLNLLAKQGKIHRIEMNNTSYFDANKCDHQHQVCMKCGKISDIFYKNITEYAMKKADSTDFTPKCVTVVYHGVCKSCR